MITDYIGTCFEEVAKEIIESRESGDVWTVNIDRKLGRFVGFVNLFS